jgi:PAS domain S-box-containing protein
MFLLLLNLAIPILLWAGQHTQPNGDPDTYVLTITLGSDSSWLPVFVFLGGLSAATAMVIVTVLALASMCLNHLVLPYRRASQGDLYRFLRWARRWLVIAILAGAYAIYSVLGEQSRLVEVGLLSFVAVAQFLPGLVGVLFWRRATGGAVLRGLIAGITVWLGCAVGPLLVRSQLLPPSMDVPALLGIAAADSLSFAIFLSLGANAAILGWIGIRREPTLEELQRARTCIDAGDPVLSGRLEAGSPTDFTRALVPQLGIDVAAREVARAVGDVGVGADEQRPAELRRLRDRLRRNLSGLVGPLKAEAILDAGLRIEPGAGSVAERIQALDSKLAAGHSSELARELDQVRRYLGDLLDQLPVGVCAVGVAGEVVLWNRALTAITGAADDAMIGTQVALAVAPWGPLLDAFLRDPIGDREFRAPRGDGEDGRFRLRKNHVMGTAEGGVLAATADGVVVLVEDLTDRVTLEARLEHRERLALIGQLGATMAHEVGNPLAAIDSMAQNLQAELSDPDVHQRLQRIRDQVRHIVNIVSSMVAYSRADASSSGAPAGWFSVSEAVDEAVSLIRLGSSSHHHAIVNRCAAGIRLFGDRTRLLQVFVNLVRNACDASPVERPIEVRSRVEEHSAVIEIVDRGAGIPAAIRGRLFEPFVTTKQVGKGTGLGLSLVHNIVRDHGGSLEVDSAVGEGTTVRLRLPLEPAT